MIGPAYYLFPSMPTVFDRREPPMTLEAFHTACGGMLTGVARDALAGVSLNERRPLPLPLPVVDRWHDREAALRGELAVLRARRLGWDVPVAGRDFPVDPAARRIAGEAFALPSPREAEDLLDARRWEFLQAIDVADDLDLERLALYSLRLQWALRRAGFDRNRGEARLDRHLGRVAQLTQSAIQGTDE